MPQLHLLSAGLALCGSAVLYFFAQLYKARSAFYNTKVKHGLPMPPWNPIFGHLLALDNAFKKYNLPPDIQLPDVHAGPSKDFTEESDGLFYLDLWPFISGPMMMVASPHYAQQACQKLPFASDRPDDLLRSMHAITGGRSVFATNGLEWKEARNLLQAGLNSNYVLGHMGHVVDEAEVLIEILEEKARTGDVFQLDHLTVKYMMDISGNLTLNRSLHCQTKGHPFASAMRNSIDWHYLGELKSAVVRWTPLLGLITWYNARTMNNYLSKVLDECYEERRAQSTSNKTSGSVIDILLSDYESRTKDKTPATLDKAFKKWAIPQLRIMFFVGHDSSAATLSYTFYLLHQNPSVKAKLRAEHDDVFGTHLADVPNFLRTQPHLLNKLPYTTAVIKEVLRLFPPASAFRMGRPNTPLLNSDGKAYPTDDTRIWVLHSVLHRNPRYWKDPLKFMPERFLVGPEDPLYPVKGAYRPFEHGPRDCIGQALAMSKLKISVVLLARRFEVVPAYEEWDERFGIPGVRTSVFEGERAYQVGQAGAHPADGFPCRIKIRE